MEKADWWLVGIVATVIVLFVSAMYITTDRDYRAEISCAKAGGLTMQVDGFRGCFKLEPLKWDYVE